MENVKADTLEELETDQARYTDLGLKSRNLLNKMWVSQ